MKTQAAMVSRIPVYHLDGTRIADTKPARARKLIQAKQAIIKKIDGSFCLQMIVDTRRSTNE